MRESKILEDSIYRIPPNLTLASANLDSVYVCDTAYSTVYLLNKELTFIVKQIGNMGSVPGYFINPNDIYFYSNSIFVLDSGNSRIQKFHLDGVFIEAMQLFKNEESNELFENSKNLAIGEDIIAVNAPDKVIHIYSMDLNLGLIINFYTYNWSCTVGNDPLETLNTPPLKNKKSVTFFYCFLFFGLDVLIEIQWNFQVFPYFFCYFWKFEFAKSVRYY